MSALQSIIEYGCTNLWTFFVTMCVLGIIAFGVSEWFHVSITIDKSTPKQSLPKSNENTNQEDN